MRALIATLSLAIAGFSLGTDALRPSAESKLCRAGFCRFDQIVASIDAQGMQPGNMADLLANDPQNPLVWCAYGDVLAQRNDAGQATAAFDEAVRLGPNMPPVLMRAVNFYFSHGQANQALPLSQRILRETDAFDQILFSYFEAAQTPTPQVLEEAIPKTPRAASSWMNWEQSHGSDADLDETWAWMKANRLLDKNEAVSMVWTLWSRKSYDAAAKLWQDWTGVQPAWGELIANADFQDPPAGGPFDWTIEFPKSVTVNRDQGLEVRFSGTENVVFSQVREGLIVKPGTYRFRVELESDGINTDQGPFFHIFDPANPGRFQTESEQVKGTTPRSSQTLTLTVPAGTRALVVQLERRQSERFDNKIEGRLHIYRVSLRSIDR